jgi:hypothetical protein
MRLFVGDDWAEDHHDVEVMDEAGKVWSTTGSVDTTSSGTMVYEEKTGNGSGP